VRVGRELEPGEYNFIARVLLVLFFVRRECERSGVLISFRFTDYHFGNGAETGHQRTWWVED
jgi:hypothetical protein